MPRSVPALWLKETFAWTTAGSRPCSANSFAQYERAKKPRSSERSSSSMRKASFTSVSWKITLRPPEPLQAWRSDRQPRRRRRVSARPASRSSRLSAPSDRKSTRLNSSHVCPTRRSSDLLVRAVRAREEAAVVRAQLQLDEESVLHIGLVEDHAPASRASAGMEV